MPVESIASAETLAVGEAIDEGKVIVRAFEDFFGFKIQLSIAIDSKDLLTILLTRRLASDRSIRGDLGSIRFDFATKNISNMIWIRGNSNLADPGTKPNCQLTDTLQLLVASGKLPIDFNEAVIQPSDQVTG